MSISQHTIKLAFTAPILPTSSGTNGGGAQQTSGPTKRVVKRPGVASPSSSSSGVEQQEVFLGFVAHPTAALSAKESYPTTGCVIVLPTVRGITPFEMQKAVELAQLGYTGVAVDLYGAKFPTDKRMDPKQIPLAFDLMNELLANPVKHRALLCAWVDLCLTLPTVNRDIGVVATGYCFGGSCTFELLRAGHPALRGIVSFHGIPDALPAVSMTGKPAPPMVCPKPPSKINPKCKVLIETGRRDAMAPKEMIERAEKELVDAGTETFMVVTHGTATHGFAILSPPQVDPNIVSHHHDAWVASTIHMRSFLRSCFRGADSKENPFDLGKGGNLASFLEYKGDFKLEDSKL